jgi:hypothetical protein
VVWAIPLQYYGSPVCYILLLLLARVVAKYLRNGIRCCIFTHLYGSRELALLLLHWRYVAADHNPHQEVSNTQPTRHSILSALLFGVVFYIAGLPTFSLSDAHLRPVPGSETVRWLTLVATRRPSALHVVTIRNLSFALNLPAPTLKRNFRDEPLSIPRQNLLSLYLIHLFFTALFGLRMQKFLVHLVWCSGKHEDVAVLVGLCRLICPVHGVGGVGREVVYRPSLRFARWLEERVLEVLSLTKG